MALSPSTKKTSARLPFLILLFLRSLSSFSSSPDTFVELAARWEVSQLRICFAPEGATYPPDLASWTEDVLRTRGFSSVRRQTIKDLLLTNYPKNLTGISLVGFKECPGKLETSSADVIIMNDVFLESGGEGQAGVASIGDSRLTWYDGMKYKKAALGINHFEMREALRMIELQFSSALEKFLGDSGKPDRLSAERVKTHADTVALDLFHYTGVHEFGHILGLRHEEGRTDAGHAAAKYAFCKTWAGDWWAGDIGKSVFPGGEDPSTLGTAYDFFSIMSYCRTDMIKLFRRARLVCQYQDRLKAVENPSPELATAIEGVLGQCGFVNDHDFPLGLTATDRVGLRGLYGIPYSAQPEEMDFSHSATKRGWIDVFTAMDDFIEALGFSPDYDKILTELRTSGRSFIKE